MMRWLTVCALLPLLSGVCLAEDKPTETVVHLTVSPMAAPTPALKYQLLPDLSEATPGNPVLGFLKCFMEQQNFFFSKDATERRDKWAEMPMQDLPLKEVERYGYLGGERGLWHWVMEAARMDHTDWQILPTMKAEGYNTLLPEVQQLRMLASALKIRFKAQAAGRHFDDAIATARTMFALSRIFGEHPSWIGDLVGIAIAGITLDPLEEMIGQPGCPNLYWALTDLPLPLIDIRRGSKGERLMLEVTFVGLDEKEPMSEAQLNKIVDRIRQVVLQEGATQKELQEAYDRFVRDENYARAARKRLIDSGLPRERVDKFPVMQVLLLDGRNRLRVLLDDELKWISLPYPQAARGLRATHNEAERPLVKLWRPFPFMASLKIRGAQARTDQRIAMLRIVEAVRMYAAEHDGNLPTSLADIRLPLPHDPINGKAFDYRVEGGQAVLKGGTPKGEETNPAYHRRYVITIRK